MGRKSMQLPHDIIKSILKDRETYDLSFEQMAKALARRAGLKISKQGLYNKLKREGYLQ